MAFISYTERPISALGSAWEAGTRLIWSKPFIMGPEYSPIRWTAFWNRAHQKHAHPNQCVGLTGGPLGVPWRACSKKLPQEPGILFLQRGKVMIVLASSFFAGFSAKQ